MDVYTTEEQQIEAIKKWWNENKWSLIGGVVIGVGALWGGRTWLDNQQVFSEAASTSYQMMLEHMSSGRNDEAATQGAQLLGQFSDTPYSSLAALAMAKLKLDGGDAAAASSHLRWALDNTQEDSVRHESRLRLAKLLLAEAKHDDALALLNAGDTGVYTARYEQLKGDVNSAAGKPESARTAYNRALTSMAPTERGRELLQMKLDNLGSTHGQAVAGAMSQ
ncbi:MAG: tetratricopeptide repeat protein [Ectothiorhodospiraceae bacterium]|nr:tetratricopeptide repeat protein [Ectothiorhodospiraceae bacterium]